jgi:hypothetical protein
MLRFPDYQMPRFTDAQMSRCPDVLVFFQKFLFFLDARLFHLRE